MKISRDWFTPLTLGAFGLMATTGVLMFFHLDSGLNSAAHEWLGWLLLAAVGGHVAANYLGFKRYFTANRARVIIAAFAVVLAATFLPIGGEDKPPFAAPIAALASAPLPVLAQVAGVPVETLRLKLSSAGVQVDANTTTLAQATGKDLRAQMRALNAVLK
jgi:hypothetical protein